MSHLSRAQGPTQIYPDGNFTYPDRFPLSFYEGSEIVITWTTVYKRSNLFVAQYENDGDSVPIASMLCSGANRYDHISIANLLPLDNIQDTSRPWVVKTAYTNLTLPFHFRIVSSEGSDADQASGGFWSPGFYILRAATSSSTTSGSLTASQSSQTSGSLTTSPSSSQISTAVASPASPITSGPIAGIAIAAIVFFGVSGGLLFYLGKRSRQPVRRSKLPRTGEVGQEHVMYADAVNPEPGRGKVWGRHEATMLDGRQLPAELT